MGLQLLVGKSRTWARRLDSSLPFALVPRRNWLPYRDAWVLGDDPSTWTPEIQRLASLPHMQIGQIALASRLVYLAVPKAANSFMRRWINSLEASKSMGLDVVIPAGETYAPEWQFCQTVGQISPGLKRHVQKPTFRFFTVVRDPYHRVASAYLDKRRLPDSDPVKAKLPAKAWTSLDAFVQELNKGNRLVSDGHWAPQSWLVGDAITDLDAVLRVENLEAELEQFNAEHGGSCQVMPDHHEHAMRSDLDSRRMSAETRAVINHLYAQDFKAFGYSIFS